MTTALDTMTDPAGAPLADRLVDAAVGTLELWSVWLGDALGLYTSLREAGPATPPELAERVGIAPRYAREWLEQQAVAGLLCVDDPWASADARVYRLPVEHAGVLCDPESPDHVAPLARMLRAIASVLPRVEEAYRRGTGVPFGAYGLDMACGQGAINRPLLSHAFVEAWLPRIPEIDARLRRRGVRVIDVGCGLGWSTIALAAAYPAAEVIGIDLDRASIDRARKNGAARGSRARFDCRDVAELGRGFDVAIVFESLHDMSRPVDVLSALHENLAAGGSVIVVDERVQPRFTAPGDRVERLMYGWSVSHCLPAGMDHPEADPIGTVARPAEIARVAALAGFSCCEEQSIEHDFFRVYRLRP